MPRFHAGRAGCCRPSAPTGSGSEGQAADALRSGWVCSSRGVRVVFWWFTPPTPGFQRFQITRRAPSWRPMPLRSQHYHSHQWANLSAPAIFAVPAAIRFTNTPPATCGFAGLFTPAPCAVPGSQAGGLQLVQQHLCPCQADIKVRGTGDRIRDAGSTATRSKSDSLRFPGYRHHR